MNDCLLHSWSDDVVDCLYCQIEKLEKENARLREGLKFYADEINYYARLEVTNGSSSFASTSFTESLITNDQGKHARACLQGENLYHMSSAEEEVMVKTLMQGEKNDET